LDDSGGDGQEYEEETATQSVYKSIMNDREFILTFQPKKLEDKNSESEEEDDETKLLHSNGGA